MREENGTGDVIRESYDRLAEEYARRLFHELAQKPLDHQLLQRLAALTAGRGQVCDMGCGPGQVARYLHDCGGCDVFGLDLSPKMIASARRLNPGIPFRVGNMLALELADHSLAGIAAFYAIVNIAKSSLPVVFREMLRVLQPSGLLLLAFHIGDEVVAVDDLWGYKVSMPFYLFPTHDIRTLLERSGFRIEEVVEREPYAPDVEYQSRRAYILARKAL